MKIGCFGCSFTGGKGGDQKACWPDELAKQTKYQVYNYGRAGLDNQGILYFFEKYSHLYDYNIVKMTDHCRLTSIHKSLEEISKVRDNYYAWNSSNKKRILTLTTAGINPDWIDEPWQKVYAIKYHEMWLRHRNWDYEEVQSIAIKKYLISQADFTYFHYNRFNFLNLPTAEDNVEGFNNHLFDGHHSDIHGVKKEAEWINTVIERSNK